MFQNLRPVKYKRYTVVYLYPLHNYTVKWNKNSSKWDNNYRDGIKNLEARFKVCTHGSRIETGLFEIAVLLMTPALYCCTF